MSSSDRPPHGTALAPGARLLRMAQFRVTATSLNLRSAPTMDARRIAVLPHGHVVRLVQGLPDQPWWKVETSLQSTSVEGFVARAHLEPTRDEPSPPDPIEARAVHLAAGNPASARSRTDGRAFPLAETGAPTRSGETPPERAARLSAIVDWLAVETSARYQPAEGATYCNVYAYDYCLLAGVYLPRVWWTPRALVDLAAGLDVPVRYGVTVREVNANGLFDWLVDFGTSFGWQRCFDLDVLQDAANQGCVTLACAKRIDLNRSGHVVAVVPESGDRRAARAGDRVVVPLQSQAGVRNFQRASDTGVWWMHPRFRDHAFWMHP
jgi:hypothetical protein